MLRHREFAKTYVGLLALLWDELESLLAHFECNSSSPCRGPMQARAEAFLVELDLLRECCDASPVCNALSLCDRTRVLALLDDVGELLDFQPMELPNPEGRAAIMRTQNRLFDEVYEIANQKSYFETQGRLLSENEVLALLDCRSDWISGSGINDKITALHPSQ